MDRLVLKLEVMIIIIFFAVFLSVAFYRSFDKVSNRREVTATVIDKVNNSKCLVYTEDENGDREIFEVTDALFAWQFDSFDIYMGIETGKTYKFDIGGSKNSFFSWYPNLYGYEETDE